MSNILYYSKFCGQSIKVIALLQKHELVSVFDEIVCVDNADNTNVKTDIPKSIKSVPTIITPDYDVPLTDSNVIRWIEYMLIKRNNKMKQNHYNNNDVIRPKMSKPRKSDKQELQHAFEKLQNERNYEY